MMTGVGIDGAPDGWIAATYTGTGWTLEHGERLQDVATAGALIDIPLGLPADSQRACDQCARDRLTPHRHQSVFSCPVRSAVYADSYEEACDINEERTGRRISIQAWNIVPKIREADTVAQELDLRESHPELLFQALDQAVVRTSKHTEEGVSVRRSVLTEHGSLRCLDQGFPAGAGTDDVLDAMVLALAADSRLKPLPPDAPTDAQGIPMQIWTFADDVRGQ